MKLYEIILSKLFPRLKKTNNQPEATIGCNNNNLFNPLSAKVGQIINFDVTDYRDNDYKITNIINHLIKLMGKHFITDYICEFQGNIIKIRCDDKRIILLTKFDSFGFNEEFSKILEDQSIVTEIGEFWRIGDITTSYTSDFNGGRMKFWDYSRITKLDNTDLEQYLYVEQCQNTGWFDIYTGIEILKDNITTY